MRILLEKVEEESETMEIGDMKFEKVTVRQNQLNFPRNLPFVGGHQKTDIGRFNDSTGFVRRTKRRSNQVPRR